jgi:uncharacterized protein
MKLPIITEQECEGCGACCRRVGYPPFMRNPGPGLPAEQAWIELPKRLKDEVQRHVNDDGEPCIWLGADGRCLHYDHRPQICRDFERGGDVCRRIRRDAGRE